MRHRVKGLGTICKATYCACYLLLFKYIFVLCTSFVKLLIHLVAVEQNVKVNGSPSLASFIVHSIGWLR